MAAGGLLAVIDDITVLLDDVAAMSKIAAKKTAGIVGDDLAVNANVVVGIEPNRELPIVGKIAFGSLINKAVLIPLALALPAAAIQPLLMIGGAFLCYEAVHKLSHKEPAEEEAHHQEVVETNQRSPEEMAKLEKDKVMGAIGTDFILSAEVIAVALGTVAAEPMAKKALALTVVGVGMTVGVYGLVAGIVKIDDLGMYFERSSSEGVKKIGRGLLVFAPWLMKTLSFLGTVAMFTVGGGLLMHGIPGAEQYLHSAVHGLPGLLQSPVELLAAIVLGALIGWITSPIFNGLGTLISKLKGSKGEEAKH